MESVKSKIFELFTNEDGPYFYKNTYEPQGFNITNFDDFNMLIGVGMYNGAPNPKVNNEVFNSHYVMGICKANGELNIEIQNIEYSDNVYKFYYTFNYVKGTAVYNDLKMAYVEKKDYKSIEFYENGNHVQTVYKDELPEPKNKTMDWFTYLIKDWYEVNFNGFKDKYNAAVKNVKPIPEDTDPIVIHNWKDATIDDLCNFFNDWYKWNPDVETGLEYIQRFSWLYYENKYGLDFVTTYPGNLMTKYYVEINGEKMDSPESRNLAEKWEKELGDKMNEYIIPEGGFKTFNEFFTREIKEGERPISNEDDDSVVVSPADAIVNMIDDNLSLESTIKVKTQDISVLQLLNNSDLAKNFEGGTALSCILMPDVYHRYHSPVSGLVVESEEDVAGNYFGIEDFPKLINGGNVGYGYDYSVFEHFRRGYMIIDTKKYGYVGMIPVGLNTIASVIFHDKFKKVNNHNPIEIKKGEEIGYFQYGGSLNILLFEKDCFPAVRIPQGQIIGTLNEKQTVENNKVRKKTQFLF
jgi:phosphatidylserine decarboxylase